MDQLRHILRRVIFVLSGNSWVVARHHKCAKLLEFVQNADQVKVATAMGTMDRLEAQK
jgi:hypothetical protein